MSKRGRRARPQRGPHQDRYAAKAAKSQTQRAALNAQWEREHPASDSPPTNTPPNKDEEEVAE